MLSERGAPSIQLAPVPQEREFLRTIPQLGTCTDTKVLLAVSVAGNVDFSLTDWTEWLNSDEAPPGITKIDARIESAYESNSTIILISVPTLAWSRMVDREAYNLIGFIKSENLLTATETQGLNTAKRRKSKTTLSPEPSFDSLSFDP